LFERFAFEQRARGLNTHLLHDAVASNNKREEQTTMCENKFSNMAVAHPRARYINKKDLKW